MCTVFPDKWCNSRARRPPLLTSMHQFRLQMYRTRQINTSFVGPSAPSPESWMPPCTHHRGCSSDAVVCAWTPRALDPNSKNENLRGRWRWWCCLKDLDCHLSHTKMFACLARKDFGLCLPTLRSISTEDVTEILVERCEVLLRHMLWEGLALENGACTLGLFRLPYFQRKDAWRKPNHMNSIAFH